MSSELLNSWTVADYNNDGWPDIYAVGGEIGPNRLYKNLQNGTFQEVAAAAGVDTSMIILQVEYAPGNVCHDMIYNTL